MKKSMVVVCGNYYPSPSPTGLCTRRYLELVSLEYDIDIICLSQNGINETVTKDGFNIHTLSGKRMSLEYKSRGILKKIIHLIGAAQIKFLLLGNLNWFRKSALKKLTELNKKRKIDVIFSICSPFAAHTAAFDFKNRFPDTRVCFYTVDPYSSAHRIRPLFCDLKNLISKEREILLKSDTLLVSEEVYDTRKDLYLNHTNCISLPYLLPDISDSKECENIFEKNVINCVYAGRFYNDIRNPEFLLNTFSKLKDNIVLHLYSVGCEEIVEKYHSNNILIHGIVSQDEIQNVYNSADILIGVGNSTKDFLPSKTFEYIANLKPIIYFNYAGLSNEVLNKYPCSLQLDNAESVIDATKKVSTFCETVQSNIIEKEEISKIYFKHSKDNIKNILLNAFNQ